MPANELEEFERVWPWLEGSLAYNAYVHNGVAIPTHGKLNVWQRIATGRARLWAAPNSVIVSEFIDHPSGLRSHNTWLAGGDVEEIAERMPMVEAWGYAHGCHRQIGSGRRGWLRVFSGYHEYGWRKQKDLLAAGETAQLHK